MIKEQFMSVIDRISDISNLILLDSYVMFLCSLFLKLRTAFSVKFGMSSLLLKALSLKLKTKSSGGTVIKCSSGILYLLSDFII